MTSGRRSPRQQLLFEHDVLRALLEQLAETAESVLRGEAAVQQMRDAARSLQAVLDAHVAQEEKVLAPLLARRGPGRMQALRSGHRKALETLRRLRTRPAEQAAASSRRLVPHLIAAIEAEAKELLAAPLWRTPPAAGEVTPAPGKHP